MNAQKLATWAIGVLTTIALAVAGFSLLTALAHESKLTKNETRIDALEKDADRFKDAPTRNEWNDLKAQMNTNFSEVNAKLDRLILRSGNGR